MAKKTTSKPKSKGVSKKPAAERRSDERGRRTSDNAGDAFIKLLQSPFVAELVAVAATAALAALAEQGFSSRGGGGGNTGKRAGRAVKAAGAAAAAAVGRRLNTELDEIRKAAKESKAGAKA
ncbi:MAG TPA: hypothetical protein VE221_09815 [Sphingomicrobium sp.]|jgi:hypothetical protein|nr:hypothetical protein [Sphingomicrobium sp.]